MKIARPVIYNQALTRVELLVIIASVVVLYVLLAPGNPGSRERARRMACVNNLKQIGLAVRVWDEDQGAKFPWQVASTNGGTKESISGLNAWRHFQELSNQLSTPRILVCPADIARFAATEFSFFNNSNLSYFVGIDASETDPQTILFGDRNITNGTSIRNGILELSTNHPAGWTAEIHNSKVGTLVLADGSVQQVSQTGLRQALVNSNPFTNRFQMPILNP